MKNYITRTATIKSAKVVPSINKTFAYVQLEGEDHITQLWLAGASEKRAEFLTNGKRISYESAGIRESVKDNKHIFTDNTFRITFLPDVNV